MDGITKAFPRWWLLWITFICGFQLFQEAWVTWRLIWADNSLHRARLFWCHLSPYAPTWDFSPWSIRAYLAFVQADTTKDQWVDAVSVDPTYMMPDRTE